MTFFLTIFLLIFLESSEIYAKKIHQNRSKTIFSSDFDDNFLFFCIRFRWFSGKKIVKNLLEIFLFNFLGIFWNSFWSSHEQNRSKTKSLLQWKSKPIWPLLRGVCISLTRNNPPDYYSTIVLRGVRGDVNWAFIMPREPRLSASGCQFFSSVMQNLKLPPVYGLSAECLTIFFITLMF